MRICYIGIAVIVNCGSLNLFLVGSLSGNCLLRPFKICKVCRLGIYYGLYSLIRVKLLKLSVCLLDTSYSFD